MADDVWLASTVVVVASEGGCDICDSGGGGGGGGGSSLRGREMVRDGVAENGTKPVAFDRRATRHKNLMLLMVTMIDSVVWIELYKKLLLYSRRR